MLKTIKEDIEFARLAEPEQIRIIKNIHKDDLVKDIWCSQYEDQNEKDIKEHIDIIVYLMGGREIYYQCKALRLEFYDFDCFTIEYLQNRYTYEEGEIFTIKADYFLHGYFDPERKEYKKYYMIDVKKFKEWFSNYLQKEQDIHNREELIGSWFVREPKRSRANFLRIPYKLLPAPVVIGKGGYCFEQS